jgi:hypothetical protein
MVSQPWNWLTERFGAHLPQIRRDLAGHAPYFDGFLQEF